jgi:hypothetical protein
MKRILLVLLVLIGLQTQAQIIPCDSMTVTGSQYQLTMEIININTLIDYWITTAPDMTVLAEDSMSNTHMVYNTNPMSFVPYDTLITCITSSSTQITCCVTWIWNGTMWMKMGSQQLNLCDSLSYTTSTNIPTWPLIVTGNISMPGMLSWSWSVCNSSTCYSDTGQVGYFGQISLSDTLKVCYDAYIDINGVTYVCTSCDSLVYDGNQWVLFNTGNPTGINELQFTWEDDGKIYDLLGRELTEAPVGTMYIRNNKKYIRVK